MTSTVFTGLTILIEIVSSAEECKDSDPRSDPNNIAQNFNQIEPGSHKEKIDSSRNQDESTS